MKILSAHRYHLPAASYIIIILYLYNSSVRGKRGDPKTYHYEHLYLNRKGYYSYYYYLR